MLTLRNEAGEKIDFNYYSVSDTVTYVNMLAGETCTISITQGKWYDYSVTIEKSDLICIEGNHCSLLIQSEYTFDYEAWFTLLIRVYPPAIRFVGYFSNELLKKKANMSFAIGGQVF